LIVAFEERFPSLFHKQQHPLLGSPTLNVGIIQGGVQVNQVPDSCTLEVDRRLLPGETKATVWKEFESLIAELRVRDPELDVEMEPPILEDFPLETSAEERIVRVVTNVSQQVRGSSQLVGVPYGSDASKLARAGIPSIILGPGSIDQAHTAEEYVELDQVALAAEIYLRMIMEF
jgi:acetylornithine deacetylase